MALQLAWSCSSPQFVLGFGLQQDFFSAVCIKVCTSTRMEGEKDNFASPFLISLEAIFTVKNVAALSLIGGIFLNNIAEIEPCRPVGSRT